MKHRAWLSAALLALGLTASARAATIQGILVDPPNPTSRDRIELTAVGTQHPECPFIWKAPTFDLDLGTIALHTTLPECGSPLPVETEFRKTFVLDPLPAGTYYARVEIAGLPYATPWDVLRVRPPESSLRLGQDDRFRVSVEWSNPGDGSHGIGNPLRLAEDSGAFSFFSSENLEVTVKILDGRPVNGHWWVFIASMTDVEVKVTILENRNDCLSLPVFPPDCPTKTYTQTAGQNRNFVDVNAFAEPASLAPLPAAAVEVEPEVEDQTSIRIEPERPTPLDPIHVTLTKMHRGDPELRFVGVQGQRIVFQYLSDQIFLDVIPPVEPWTIDATVGPLKAGIYTVELEFLGELAFQRAFAVREPSPELVLPVVEGRIFSVTVDFKPPPGSNLRGTAYGVPLTRQSGYFWFFDPENVEITVKILDGRAVNGKYWVFLSSMTDVEFTATVSECPSNPEVGAPCVVKEYHSQRGANRNIIDVNFQGF